MYRVTFKHSHNQAILGRLIIEVKSLNPIYLTEHVKSMQSYSC